MRAYTVMRYYISYIVNYVYVYALTRRRRMKPHRAAVYASTGRIQKMLTNAVERWLKRSQLVINQT